MGGRRSLDREGDGSGAAGDGHLVSVRRAMHQAEAELIQGILRNEGIRSMTKRSGGFDIPDFLAAGPRDVLVEARQLDSARDALLQHEHLGEDDLDERLRSVHPAPIRLLGAVLLFVVALSVLVYLLGAIA